MVVMYLCSLCGNVISYHCYICKKCEKEYAEVLQDPAVEMLIREEKDRRNLQKIEKKYIYDTTSQSDLEYALEYGATALIDSENNDYEEENLYPTFIRSTNAPPLFLPFWDAISYREQLALWVHREINILKANGYRVTSEEGATWAGFIEEKDISTLAYRKRLSTAWEKIQVATGAIKTSTDNKHSHAIYLKNLQKWLKTKQTPINPQLYKYIPDCMIIQRVKNIDISLLEVCKSLNSPPEICLQKLKNAIEKTHNSNRNAYI